MYVILNYPLFKGFTADGLPAAGYLVYTKDAGLSSDAEVYSNRACTIAHTNPIELDEAGEAAIFTNKAVKLIFTLPDGDPSSPIWTFDYLGEQQADIINIATANTSPSPFLNTYSACTTPVYNSIVDGFMLIFFPDVDNLGTIPVTNFTGSGKNDLVWGGPYVGTTSGSVFTVVIDGTSAPNTFKWRKDGGSWTTGVSITTEKQNLIEGMSVTFSESFGHTLNDTWAAEVTTPTKLNFCGLGAAVIYKIEDGELTALSAGDMLADVPATLKWSGTYWIIDNPSSNTAAAVSGRRSRKEIVNSDYTLLEEDAGNIIDFYNTSTQTLYLGPAANYNGMFFYIGAMADGDVAVQAYGSEVIYSHKSRAGQTYYTIPGGTNSVIQLQCNGVSWQVLMEFPGTVTQIVMLGDQTYTPGDDVRSFLVECIGSGGGGDYYYDDLTHPGYGTPGKGDGYCSLMVSNVPYAGSFAVVIGVGGNGGYESGGTYTHATDGTNTTFGAILIATGGGGGWTANNGTGVGGSINVTCRGQSAGGPYGGVGTDLGTGGDGGAVIAYPGINNGANGADGFVVVTEYR